MISGFPRSGNTYLSFAIKNMYLDYNVYSHNHTTSFLENSKNNFNIVPIRNPIDSIASYIMFLPESGSTKIESPIDCINYYIRFYKYIEKNIEKLCILDFDIFTKDMLYVTDSISKKFNIKNNTFYSNDEIMEKLKIIEVDKKFLPREYTDQRKYYNELFSSLLTNSECLDIYNRIKEKINV